MLHEPIEMTPVRSSRLGVLDRAYDLPDGWENGIEFYGVGCGEPDIVGPCVVSDTTETRPENALFEPIFIRQSAACANMSQVGTIDMAISRLRSTTEWALGRTLALATGSTNPSFADSDLVAVQASAVSAVSCLEQAISDTGFGADAMLHAPSRAAAYLKNERVMDDDGFSPTGFPWLISPGYPGGVDNGDETTVTIWATAPVFYGVTDADPLIDPSTGKPPNGWRINLDVTFAQRLGMAAFDPCLNLSATFTVPACVGGS